ncbi:putative Low-density lipoprotein receptor-related protein 5 [Hypsibius exemplaris]|uniref:Low-density lipoprotein receptor-related protein 5 n=1 Tax=Hypsibius exemplaris TaxID=2072580 RepID=A0A9X6NL04_HYPEX|nr:putative Low-density lipoprotein receptor-related protein 5 [Hypsibius exemplaris]
MKCITILLIVFCLAILCYTEVYSLPTTPGLSKLANSSQRLSSEERTILECLSKLNSLISLVRSKLANTSADLTWLDDFESEISAEENAQETRMMREEGFVIVAQGPSLWNVSDGGHGPLTNISDEENCVVAVDCPNRHIYWTNAETGIRRFGYDGSDNQLVVRKEGLNRGMAIDFVAGNLFWIQGSDIVVAKMKDLAVGYKTILRRIDSASALAVHPARGSIYWSHCYLSGSATIETAAMDGSNRRVLVTAVDARALAVDYETDDLYWTDYHTGNVESISLYGGSKRLISAQPLRQFSYGISLTSHYVF